MTNDMHPVVREILNRGLTYEIKSAQLRSARDRGIITHEQYREADALAVMGVKPGTGE